MIDRKVAIYGAVSDGGDPPVITLRAVAVSQEGFVGTNLYLQGAAIFSTNPFNPTRDPNDAPLDMVPVVNFGYLSTEDGADTFIRQAAANADNLASFSSAQGVIASAPGNWSVFSSPAVNTRATVTRAAVAGQRHVCTNIFARLLAGALVPLGSALTVNLRDGTTGAGTVLWSCRLYSPTSTQSQVGLIQISNINIIGSANTAMTLEFSAAPAATDAQDIAMTGFTTA